MAGELAYPLVCVGLVGLAAVAYVRRAARKRRWKLQHPQDHAFAAYAMFGPGRQTPERIRKEFPDIDEATLSRWLADFGALDQEIWRLLRAAGLMSSVSTR